MRKICDFNTLQTEYIFKKVGDSRVQCLNNGDITIDALSDFVDMKHIEFLSSYTFDLTNLEINYAANEYGDGELNWSQCVELYLESERGLSEDEAFEVAFEVSNYIVAMEARI